MASSGDRKPRRVVDGALLVAAIAIAGMSWRLMHSDEPAGHSMDGPEAQAHHHPDTDTDTETGTETDTETDTEACPEAGGATALAAPTSGVAPARLSAEAAVAVDELAVASAPLACGAIAAAAEEGAAHGGGEHADHDAVDHPVVGADAALLETQWGEAVSVAEGLALPEQAAAAGYVKASAQVPGVGTHWINWTLIDRPFDVARPSMLLFDETPGRPPRLAGFSYWVRSPVAPDGFAGPSDVWHRHLGLCFADGWTLSEQVPAADACPGDWLNGSDLWMLHAWVVPELPNRDGRFAGRSRALCPSDFARVPDVVTCDPMT